MNMVAKIATASRKLATGPAATTAARCQTGFRWNEPARCSGVNSLSAARDGVLAALSSSMNLT